LSSRTASRRFVAETGYSFTHWRQRLRLLHAAGRLAEGVPVVAVAAESGYRNPSSFIAVFREVFGTTPGQYAATSPRRRR
jgi:AraC-like DNA-binding protein